MIRTARLALLAATLAATLAAGPAAADSMRCGTRLIVEGSTLDEVRARCGEPSAVQRREVWRRPTLWLNGRRYHVGDGEVAVPVEFWTYNFGPSKLMRRIRFEDGLVTAIETLEHGYNEP
jgi:hypothetical protein